MTRHSYEYPVHSVSRHTEVRKRKGVSAPQNQGASPGTSSGRAWAVQPQPPSSSNAVHAHSASTAHTTAQFPSVYHLIRKLWQARALRCAPRSSSTHHQPPLRLPRRPPQTDLVPPTCREMRPPLGELLSRLHAGVVPVRPGGPGMEMVLRGTPEMRVASILSAPPAADGAGGVGEVVGAVGTVV